MDGPVQNILYPVDLFYDPWYFFNSTEIFIKIKKEKKEKKGLYVLSDVPDSFNG